MRRQLQILASITWFFLLFQSAYSKEPATVVLKDPKATYRLSNTQFEFFEDKSAALTIHDMASPEYDDAFYFSEEKFPSAINPSSNYWVRFKVRNEAPDSVKWLLEAFDSRTGHLSFFYLNEKDTIEYASGNTHLFKNRLFNHKNFEFNLRLPPNIEKTYYIKVNSKFPAGMPFVIRSYTKFFGYALNEYVLLGIFYGLLLMMASYNFFLYITIRENQYLYYVLYVLSVAVFSMCQNGFAFQYLWPNHPEFNHDSYSLALFSIILWMILFAKSFFKTKKDYPLINKIINYYLLVRFVLLIIVMIYNIGLSYIFVDIIPLFGIFTFSIYFYKKGNTSARLFILSYCILFLGFLINILMGLHIIPDVIFTVYSLNFAVVMEVTMLSFALADRLKNEMKEKGEAQALSIQKLKENKRLNEKIIEELNEKEKLKDKVNRELELKVQERTKELSATKESLEDLNIKLKDQAAEIDRINQLLYKENTKLEKDIKNISKARVLNKLISFDAFKEIFRNEDACMLFLADLKTARGFQCKKCGGTTYAAGHLPFSRRCKTCNYVESVTVDTLFQGVKFPLLKAFFIISTVSYDPDISIDKLSEMVSLRRNTVWSFKKRVLHAMKNIKDFKTNEKGWELLVFSVPGK